MQGIIFDISEQAFQYIILQMIVYDWGLETYVKKIVG